MEKIDQLAQYYSQRDLLALDKQRLLNEAIPADVQKRMDEIVLELSPQLDAVNENILALEAEIKRDVLFQGQTVKGEFLMAVFAKGRTSWDSKKFEGLQILLPQLSEARKEGEPSVSIRRIG